METTSAKDLPHLPGRHGLEDTAEKLRLEMPQLPGLTSKTNQHPVRVGTPENRDAPKKSQASRGLSGNDYAVGSGDNLTSIARSMLKLRGETTSAHDIFEEVNRIVDLNSQKYPWLERNPNKIRAGMKLVVWDSETGPDPTCKWKDWKDAERGRITVAQKCESIFAGQDTQVVVTPGARAVFTPGSYGFVAPKAYARSLPGSYVIAVGGEVVDDGGEVRSMHASVKIISDSSRQAAKDSAGPTKLKSETAPKQSDAQPTEMLEFPPIDG